MHQPLTAAPVARSQFRLFQRLRWRVVANAGSLLLGNSRVRLFTVFASSVLVWAGVFAASWFGFELLHSQRIPLAGGVVGILFDFLFLALGVLLLFSTGIILFSSLFSSAESAFLLSTPAVADQVFAYKFQTAVTFSSWAFVLLSSPILIAYGAVNGVPWPFYPLLLAFFAPFLLVPGSLGALVCLVAVNYWPRRRKLALAGLVTLLLAGVAIWGVEVYHSIRRSMGTNDRDALQALVSKFTFASGAGVPSHWMTRGIQSAARGDWAEMLYPLALLWGNGLFFYLLATAAARRLYRRGYNRLATGGPARRRYGATVSDRVVAALVAGASRPTRLLIVKDFRTFRRDPAQWGQLLIFAGLASLYGLNFQQFLRSDIGAYYRNGVSLLNLTATAILMCAYMGRFIFPMLSLEGRKFWILGLLPLSRSQLLRGKFTFAAVGALVVAEAVMVAGDLLLGMPAAAVLLHALTVAVLAFGLSGLSVGLGACMPNFKETDPSKITVGFGGTLNLIVGLLFLLTVVALMAAPYHVQMMFAAGDDRPAHFRPGWVVAGAAAGLALGIAAVWVPLRLGARNLRRMEF
jgi:ABC-2 type transport system permease protein